MVNLMKDFNLLKMLSYYSIYQAFSLNSLLIITLLNTHTLDGKEDLTHDFVLP